jgi:hypothetical protein
MYEWRASLNRRIAMQGQQAKMVRPTQERAMLGSLATTRALARDRVLCLFSMKAGLRAKAMASRTWAMVTDATGQGRGRKPRQRLLYVYASLSRLDLQGFFENAILVFLGMTDFSPQKSQPPY